MFGKGAFQALKAMKAVRIHEFGGIDKLKFEECEIPKLEKDSVLIKNNFSGVNYIDTYHRTGLYPVKLPFILGRDGAGLISELGEGITDFKVGDRVAYSNGSGSYAEFTTANINNVVKLPDSVSFEQGTAAMITGLTTHYLGKFLNIKEENKLKFFIFLKVKDSYCVKKGDTVLVHASAGALGQALAQICKHIGAVVIGTTSSEEKAQIARQSGCDYVINYSKQDFEVEIKKFTNGKGCNVVYDSVGKTTSEKSLNCCAIRGFLILCGNASGKPNLIDPLVLSEKGSLTVNRPVLSHYITTREEFLKRANEVFNWMETGVLKLRIDTIYPLSDAYKAHIQLEERKSTGKLLLRI